MQLTTITEEVDVLEHKLATLSRIVITLFILLQRDCNKAYLSINYKCYLNKCYRQRIQQLWYKNKHIKL